MYFVLTEALPFKRDTKNVHFNLNYLMFETHIRTKIWNVCFKHFSLGYRVPWVNRRYIVPREKIWGFVSTFRSNLYLSPKVASFAKFSKCLLFFQTYRVKKCVSNAFLNFNNFPQLCPIWLKILPCKVHLICLIKRWYGGCLSSIHTRYQTISDKKREISVCFKR